MLNFENVPSPINFKTLYAICRRAHFEAGATLREAGQHYDDMYLIVGGSVEVDVGSGGRPPSVLWGGASIGEIGFLRGCPATATVTARTATYVLVLDDRILRRLETEEPSEAVALVRHLARTAEDRTGVNLTFASSPARLASGRGMTVHICRNADMLERAQRLRYEVYCQELGRNSPDADHGRKIIADDLDRTGITFIAVENGNTVGTLRGNLTSEGSLGLMEELHGMRTSTFYPAATGLCTKFIVSKPARHGPAAIKLISAVTRYGIRRNIRECYADCIPPLLPYYRAMGFAVSGPKFLHKENGVSYPLMLDLAKHGAWLSRDFGVCEYIGLYARARTIRWIDRLRASLGIGDRGVE